MQRFQSRLSLAMVLLLAAVCRAELDYPCNIVGAKSPTIRLRRHLFCEYERSVRPVLSKDTAVNVSIYIRPILMNFVSAVFVQLVE